MPSKNPLFFQGCAQDILRDHPKLMSRQEYLSLETHYLSLGDRDLGEMKRRQQFFALLTLMANKDMHHAVTDMGRRTKTHSFSYEKVIAVAVNNAPREWLDAHEEELYARGMIRGAQKFYFARKDVDQGSDFDLQRQAVDDRFQPILLAAIDCHFSSKNEYDWRPQGRVMAYTAVQLQKAGPEKAATLERWKVQYNPSVHVIALNSSARGILTIAEKLGIKDLPRIEGAPDDRRTSVSAIMREAVEATDTRTPEEKAIAQKQKDLRDKISILGRQGLLTEREAEMYVYMITPRDGKLPSDFAVVSRFVKGTSPGSATGSLPPTMEDVRTLRQRVPTLIANLETTLARNDFLTRSP